MSRPWEFLLRVRGKRRQSVCATQYHRRLPVIEELEARTCPSVLIPVTTRRDLVFDPTRDQLDITTSNGQVQPYSVASQTLLTPVNVGVSLNGADITPDGSALYTTDLQSNATQSVIYKVNLTTDAVTTLAYNNASAESGSYSIALGASGKGLFDGGFSGSGWVPLRQIDLTTDTLSIRTDDPWDRGSVEEVRQDSRIVRSADRSLFFITESNISNGPMFTYDAITDTFGPSEDINAFQSDLSAVSHNGGLIALIEGNVVQVMQIRAVPRGQISCPASQAVWHSILKATFLCWSTPRPAKPFPRGFQ